MTRPDTRSLHQLLAAIPRTMGDPDASAEDIDQLGKSIRERSRQVAKDLEAIAEGRRNGHQLRSAVKTPA